MALTLNQILSRLQKLAESHKQINYVFIGENDDWLHSGEVTYPACFIDVANNGEINTDGKYVVYGFKILFADLADVAINSQANEIEVFSDLTSIAQDFVAMCDYSGYNNDWSVQPSVRMELLSEKLEDIVLAVSLEMSIAVRFDKNRCAVPTSLTFESEIIPTPVQNGILTEDGFFIYSESGQILIPE